jgi:hypothetical protein
MRKLLLLLAIFPSVLSAQTTRSNRFITGPLAQRPACLANFGDIYNTNDGNGVFYCGSGGWVAMTGGGGGGTPGGSSSQFQVNSSGAFAGTPDLTFDGTHTITLGASGIITITGSIGGAGTLTGAMFTAKFNGSNLASAGMPNFLNSSTDAAGIHLAFTNPSTTGVKTEITVPSGLVVPALTVSGIGTGSCLQTSTGGLFTGTGSPCLPPVPGTPPGGIYVPFALAGGTYTSTLQGLTGASITGATSTYTISATDNLQTPTHGGSTASAKVAVTLPTATSMGIPGFVTSYCDNFYTASGPDVIIPTTWTINGAANLPVFNGICYRITVDPNLATNWLAVPFGSGDSGKLYMMNYAGSAGHVNPQACINDAIAKHTICSTLGLSAETVNTTVQLDIGDNTGAGGFMALELAPNITFSSSATSGCAFKHWHGALIFNSGATYNSTIFTPTGSGISSVWCTDAGGSTAYYQASGFQIKNQTITTSGGYDMELNGMNDGSYYKDVNVYNYINKGVHVQHSCCTAQLQNFAIFANNTGLDGLTIDYASGVSNHSFRCDNCSIGHFAPSAHHVVILDVASPNHSTVDFTGPLYMEPNPSATTTPCIDINGGAIVTFDMIEGCIATSPQIQIENVGNPFVSFRSSSIGTSGATVVNNLNTKSCATAPCVVISDSLGHYGNWSTITRATSSASPAVCADAKQCAFVIAAAASSVVVNTTAAPSDGADVSLLFDTALGARLGVTCNTTAQVPYVTALSVGVSITVNVPSNFTTNPGCFLVTIK